MRWLQDSGRQRSASGRRSPLGVRGQFESLESRSLLSANYGDLETLRPEFHGEFRPALRVVAVMIVSEQSQSLAAVYSTSTVATDGSAPWENLGFRGTKFDRHLALKLQGGSIGGNAGSIDQPAHLDGGPAETTVQFAEDALVKGASSGSSYVVPPGALGINGGPDKGNLQITTNEGRWKPLPPGPSGTIVSYFTTTAVEPQSSTSTSNSIAKTSVRDTVFDDYSANSLLLASDSDEIDASDDRDDLLPKSTNDDEAVNDEEVASSLFDEVAQTAFNALARERSAIKALLSALDEVNLPTKDEPSNSTARDAHDAPSRREQDVREFEFTSAIATQPAFDADGGMVLLENSGDANSNAYDLTAVFVADLDMRNANSMGMEAALGMYQAIDVGANDLGGTAHGEQPIAKPTATAPASVSAENAPVKKSERPS